MDFDYEISENLRIEYFDSIGGCFANREDALSAVNIGRENLAPNVAMSWCESVFL